MNEINGRWNILACAAACALGVSAAAGCGGGGGNTGGEGGAGTGSTTTASSGTTTSTGGQGTGGGSCVAASAFADLFAIADASFCAVAVYTADEAIGYQAPTWGKHGGPLLSTADAAGGGVTLTRWKAPAGTSGKLTKETAHVDAMIPATAFAGGQALDVPFFGWTFIAWSGALPDTQGKLLALKGSTIDKSFAVNGAYSFAAIGDATSGRLLFSALSPVGDDAIAVNGLYAADACDMPAPDLGAGTGCEASKEIAAWGDSSGPVAVDHAGNAFAVLPSFATSKQEARGFAAAEIARGAKATPGASMFTLDGFGSSVAAIAPTAGASGLLVFQPYDVTAKPLDVIGVSYKAAAAVTPEGAPKPLLTVPATATAGMYFMTDDTDRLWVAASGDGITTFVVLQRNP